MANVPKLALQVSPPECSVSTVTPSLASTGVPVPRRRFQRGSLVVKPGRWYGVYRADDKQWDGTYQREKCCQGLRVVGALSQRTASTQFHQYWNQANEAATK